MFQFKIFPDQEREFWLLGEHSESLNRLERRTEPSDLLTSKPSEKTFRGRVSGNQFKLISSAIGYGAFCVMTGKLDTNKGYIKIEIHRAFKVLLSILLFLPIIALLIFLFEQEKFSATLILLIVLQVMFIRFCLIEFAFRYISKESLNRFRDVLDIEWIKKQV